MLIWFVVLYLMVSVGIGLFAATRVHNAKDFAVAGRSLPLPVVTATVFATWFGAEAVFGVSATFVKDGLGGVVADHVEELVAARDQRPQLPVDLPALVEVLRAIRSRAIRVVTADTRAPSLARWTSPTGAVFPSPRREGSARLIASTVPDKTTWSAAL